jgi:hypothetical protein
MNEIFQNGFDHFSIFYRIVKGYDIWRFFVNHALIIDLTICNFMLFHLIHTFLTKKVQVLTCPYVSVNSNIREGVSMNLCFSGFTSGRSGQTNSADSEKNKSSSPQRGMSGASKGSIDPPVGDDSLPSKEYPYPEKTESNSPQRGMSGASEGSNPPVENDSLPSKRCEVINMKIRRVDSPPKSLPSTRPTLRSFSGDTLGTNRKTLGGAQCEQGDGKTSSTRRSIFKILVAQRRLGNGEHSPLYSKRQESHLDGFPSKEHSSG